MNIMQRLAAAAVGLVFAGSAAASAVGIWNTEENKAQVEISPCGENLCGTMVWLADPLDDDGQPKVDANNPDEDKRTQPIIGLRMLHDMQPAGDGKRWREGRVYDPENGRTYSAQMQLDGDTLRLRGYVGTPMLGRTTTWTRAEQLND